MGPQSYWEHEYLSILVVGSGKNHCLLAYELIMCSLANKTHLCERKKLIEDLELDSNSLNPGIKSLKTITLIELS